MTTVQDQFNEIFEGSKKVQVKLPQVTLRSLIDAADVIVVNDHSNYQISEFAERPNLVGMRFNMDRRVMFDATQVVRLNRKGECQAISTEGVTFTLVFQKVRPLKIEDTYTAVPPVPVVQEAPSIELVGQI